MTLKQPPSWTRTTLTKILPRGGGIKSKWRLITRYVLRCWFVDCWWLRFSPSLLHCDPSYDFQYHDFSRRQILDADVNPSNIGQKEDPFPKKLHAILSIDSYSHIISWLPHGRSWIVVDKDLLTTEVLPSWFKSFESFVSSYIHSLWWTLCWASSHRPSALSPSDTSGKRLGFQDEVHWMILKIANTLQHTMPTPYLCFTASSPKRPRLSFILSWVLHSGVS